jgi:predicted DNA-binding antitoxin AbrB/MazE fold protein
MISTVEAIYENGILKLSKPLDFKDGERVQVTVQRLPDIQARLDAADRLYGLVPWNGDPDELERFVMDPEFGRWG